MRPENMQDELAPGQAHKFAVGDQVIYTNPFGVCWGIRTITGLDARTGKPTYFIEPTDSPWFSVSEDCLTAPDLEDICISGYMGSDYFQKKYGRPTTREELESLLDTDPFEGEVTA